MFKLALSNITHRKMRSAVSILALAVGITLFLTLIGLTKSSIDDITNRIRNVGADIIVQSEGSSLLFGMNSGKIPYRIKSKLLEIDGVGSVSPVLVWTTRLSGAIHNIFGIEPENFRDLGGDLQFLEGRSIQNEYEIFVDQKIASAENFAVGQKITLLDQEFEIVGICRAGIGSRIFMPIGTLKRLLHQEDLVSLFFVKCESPELVNSVSESIARNIKGLKAEKMENISQSMAESLKGLNQFIGAITSTAMIIGILVILLAMYTTVVERTKEIGILKSLGASKSYILASILSEAGLLSIAGGIVGTLLTYVARGVIHSLYPLLQFEVYGQIIAMAVLMGIIVGVLGALYPAFWAASRDPLEALVYD